MASQNVTLNVDGMSCGHCSGTVQRTLEEIDGISNVSVDLEGKKATFDADGSGLIDKAVKKINEAGYKASNK
ncbi:MAG: heavy-metal-associated domain-containing protein [Deltaproteobacteria bacterium]|nr:heavy-metal-associated domain-containing protein [Deltaproteobacteria bacterium]